MAYGEIKVDTITFTDGGIDKSVSISGLVQNPTFSGSITVTGTISGNTLQGQTISGVTVTGATAQFTSGTFISFTGTTATITSGIFASGTAAAPSVSVGTTDNGLYSPGADQLAISTNGTGRLFVDASGNINVGTTFAGFGNGSGMEIQRSTTATLRLTGDSGVGCEFYNTGSLASIQTRSTIPFTIQTNELERLRITSDGKLGLGTSSPNSRLHLDSGSAGLMSELNSTNANGGYISFTSSSVVYGDIGTAAQLVSAGSASDFAVNARGSRGLALGTNNTSRLYINSSGNVGINTTVPAATLHSRSDNAGSGSTPLLIQNRSISANTAVGISFAPNISDTTDRSAIIYGVNSSGGSGNATDLTFHTNANGASPSEKARITSDGKLGLGTSSPSSEFHAVGGSLYSAIKTGSTVYIGNTGTGIHGRLGVVDSSGFGIQTAWTGDNNGYNLLLNPYGGNVGIGTTSPSTLLHLSQSSSGAAVVSRIENTNTAADSDAALDLKTPNAVYTLKAKRSGTRCDFEVDGSPKLSIDTSGNVGIGTTSPATTLEVQNSTDPKIRIGDGIRHFEVHGGSATQNAGIGTDYNSGFDFFVNGETNVAATIDSSGRLLVGTSTSRQVTIGESAGWDPRVQVTKTGTDGGNIAAYSWSTYNTSTGGGQGIGPDIVLARSNSDTEGTHVALTSAQLLGRITFNGSNGSAFAAGAYIAATADDVWASGDHPTRLVFSTTADGASSPTERMRIHSNGDITIAKTAQDYTTAGAWIQSTGLINSAASGLDFWNAYNTAAGAYRFWVSSAGTINATSTTISAISDIRFKENITDIDRGLAEILALKPRKFDWKDGKGRDIKNDRGFIAQEFEIVFPDLIDEWKDPAPEGEEPYKSVRQDLIPILVKAIQEQQAMIIELQTKVAALEGV